MGNLSPGDGKKSRESAAPSKQEEIQSESSFNAEPGKPI